MSNAGIRARAILLGSLALLGVVFWAAPALGGAERGTDNGKLHVVFFDVGQGDAIFIESPTGVQVLIDGGPDTAILRRLSREMGFFDRSIDMVIATHEDKDHIGGLPDVFQRYQVGTYVRTENEGESLVADTIDTLSISEGSDIVYARSGMQFDLGGGAVLEVLFPDRSPSLFESNTSSIVARLLYGQNTFIFTGDSPKAIEEYLVDAYDTGLKSDVLKVGHHGSRTSTSDIFLDVVDPALAIISAGEDNRYGHPHAEVVDALISHAITIKNTAEDGSISVESNGETLQFK